uniref:72 kDa type IV collagenase-like isoform X2 n=1 Tax=Styela clava TaxID=7725 RepID=UPI00193A8546|nr:72 kDa type IV collagenase-like isoform X2 [Styela clava]
MGSKVILVTLFLHLFIGAAQVTFAMEMAEEMERYFKMIESEMKRKRQLSSDTRLDPKPPYQSATRTCSIDPLANVDENSRGPRSKRQHGVLIETPVRWHKNSFTYKLHNYPTSLTEKETSHAILRAFNIWSKYSDLSFHETKEERADFHLRFHKGDHGDGVSLAFDGPGGHLAHAHCPQSGEIHFDADENWGLRASKLRHRLVTSSTGKRSIVLGAEIYSLVLVALHEIGHALGLQHTDEVHGVMYPLYSERILQGKILLHESDIEALQNLYGPRTRPRIRPYFEEMPIFKKINERRKIDPPNPCNTTIDAMFSAEGITYFFKGRYYWTMNETTRSVTKPDKIRRRYRLSKPRIDASCYSEFSKRTYIFSGHKYWRHFDGRCETGYPRLVRNHRIPTKPDAAIHIPGTHYMVIFKKKRYYIFDELNEKVKEFYPQDSRQILPQDSLPLDAAIGLHSVAYFVSRKTVLKLERHNLERLFLRREPVFIPKIYTDLNSAHFMPLCN